MLLQSLDKLFDAVQTFFQVFVRIAVGQTDIPLGAKVDAGDQTNEPFLQHFQAECLGIHAVSLNVDEHIESTLRLLDLQSHIHQSLVHIVAALAEQFPHITGIVIQCCNTAGLYKRRCGHHHMLVENLDAVTDWRICQAITQTPAGHGIRLGESLNNDDAVTHILILGKAVVTFGIDQLAVHIVTEDKDGLVHQNSMDCIQSILRINAAGGIVERSG